ncbi:BTB/POZ domain-containing protein [Botrytis cinerea]
MSPARSSDNESVDTTKGLWAKMMGANEYSDFVIKCHSRIFPVHRIVVCTQSKPIRAAADGGFMESVTGILDLEDDDPETVARMINFLYLQDYDDTSEPTGEGVEEGYGCLLVNTMVYIIGDKYDIQALKTLARKKYEAAIVTDWNTPSFSASLELMYEELPESDTSLTSIALETAGKHLKELNDRGEFSSLCKNNPAIAYDLLTSITSQPSSYPLQTRRNRNIKNRVPRATRSHILAIYMRCMIRMLGNGKSSVRIVRCKRFVIGRIIRVIWKRSGMARMWDIGICDEGVC